MITHCIREFSKNAYRYDEHTSLQQHIAHHLIAGISGTPQTILDLGCGSGAVCKRLHWSYERFIGVDSAPHMCALHPHSETIEVVCEDFENKELFQNRPIIDLLISSSALQWASDIETLLSRISLTCKEIALAIFTDKTFQTIYEMTQIPTFLPNADVLIAMLNERFCCRFERQTFRLHFDDNLSAFRYIKKSGVSGGRKRLSVSQTKALIKDYPHSYLEFEVLFVWGVSKTF
jgi:malonyl-CoA O-methyltransferase